MPLCTIITLVVATSSASLRGNVNFDLASASEIADTIESSSAFRDASSVGVRPGEFVVDAFETIEHYRFKSKTSKTMRSAEKELEQHHLDEIEVHGALFDEDEYPVAVPLHRPIAAVSAQFNDAVHAMRPPRNLPEAHWAVGNGQRGGCSRRCSALATCAGFAWKRAVPSACAFHARMPELWQGPGRLARAPQDRYGELIPGGLRLTLDAEWSWYAKPTKQSGVGRFFRERHQPPIGGAHVSFGPDVSILEHPVFGTWWMNLKQSTGRAQSFRREVLDAHNLHHAHHIESIDYRDFKPRIPGDDYHETLEMFASVGLNSAFPCYHGDELRGNVALMLTSLIVWRSMVQDRDRYWHVWFEDDARINPKVKHFKSAIAKLIQELDVEDLRERRRKVSNFNTPSEMCIDGSIHWEIICVGKSSAIPKFQHDVNFIRPCETPLTVDCTIHSSTPTIIWLDTRVVSERWWTQHQPPSGNQAGMLINRPAALLLLELFDPHSQTMIDSFSDVKQALVGREHVPFIPGGLWRPATSTKGNGDCLNDWFIGQWAKNGAFKWGVRPWVMGSTLSSTIDAHKHG
tara:strand:+ start:306 stop:2027 length:1722 start_codon:yes stop_codon:yes gene_type:complete